MRQIRKQILTIPARLMLAAALAVGICLSGPVAGQERTLNRKIVTDPLSGVAIGGYDPVSYFTDSEPLAGRPEFEYIWDGVSWYFASGANRDIFLRTPEIYAPQFGGYGLMGLARGYLSEGNPRIYLVLENHLFLFYSTSNRDAFLLAPKSAYERAVKNWEFLSAEL